MTVIHAPTLDLARTVTPDHTVEAEYGSTVVEGRAGTWAHHQAEGRWARDTNPAPCNDPRITPAEGDVLVSHLDLDTVGGCLRLAGWGNLFSKEHASFWKLAEAVDLQGAHKLRHLGASDMDLLRLNAYWAWAKANIPRLSRDQNTDVTALVDAAGMAIQAILMGELGLLAAGRAFAEAENDLNRRTFRRREGDVLVRVAGHPGDFCNHLYDDLDGAPAKAVACLNTANGSVVVSLADPVPGVSCRDLVQGLWGPEAGGHPGIAGSPRGKTMTEADLDAAVQALSTRLHG